MRAHDVDGGEAVRLDELAFDCLGTHRDLFALPLEEMTPAAFKKTLG